MKFFSLLYGDKVVLAPGKKVIAASEFSSLLEAQELLAKIQEENVKLREEITAAAKEEGFKEGLQQWSTQLVGFEKTLADSKSELEKMIVPVAIKAAKKVVAREMDLHPDVLVDIVKQSLKSVAQHHKFTIYVSQHDFTTMDANRPRLKEGLESVESLVVSMREDIKPGDAVIETESGIINVQLEQLWDSLESAFQALMR